MLGRIVRRYRFTIPAHLGPLAETVWGTFLSMGTRSSVTSVGSQMTLKRVSALLEDVAAVSARALADFEALTVRASQLNAQTSADRDELNQWLGLVSMDMGILAGPVERPTLDGHDVHVDAMREGVAEISLAASRASVLLSSVTSLRDVLENAVRHLTSEHALATTFDSTNDHLQTAISEAREVERRRLASDIHDGPAQVLANAVTLVEVAEHMARRQPNQVADELRQVRQFLKEGVDEVRQFMQDLRPTMLEVYGLEVTLERYTADFCARWGLASTFNKNAELPQLTWAQEIAMLRILQESLRNVRSHAGPDVTVSVSVDVGPREVMLQIADNGIGFDPLLVAPKVSSGEGILGMRERASSVHGRLSIESGPGEGSIVSFALPINGNPDTSQLRPIDPGQGGLQ